MSETRRVTISRCEREPSKLVIGTDGIEWRVDRVQAILGTSEPGVYNVTVEMVEPTWPVVRMPGGARYCGHCGLIQVGDVSIDCRGCEVTLSGEVPQSKVADFLRQEG